MSKTRTGKKLLSLLLTLCMVLSLLPAMGITASAANGLTGGVLTINSAEPADGEGWDWDGTTLTLSGVDLTQLLIEVDATIVLEGANKIEGGGSTAILDSTGKNLTIKGSGTLDVIGNASATTALVCAELIVESGYISIKNNDAAATTATGINADKITVNGGYLDVTATSRAIIQNNPTNKLNYSQTGGYVKATATDESGFGIFATGGSVTVSGGYLEASGGMMGIGTAYGTFTNFGGVVKATGTSDGGAVGITFAGTGSPGNGTVGTGNFTGGVTIAKGVYLALAYSNNTTVTGDELYWATEDGTVSGGGTALKDDTTDVTKANNKYVVIAKAVSYTSGNLDGLYLYTTSGAGIDLTGAPTGITVSGGCYVESDCSSGKNYPLHLQNKNLPVSGTLVCLSSNTSGDCAAIKTGDGGDGSLTVTGTLYSYSAGATEAGIDGGSISSSGNVISVAGGKPSIASSLTVSGGYVLGMADATSSYRNAVNGISGSISATDGYITAISTATTFKLLPIHTAALRSKSVTLSGDAVVTAVSELNAFANDEEGAGAVDISTDVAVVGNSDKYTPLGSVAFNKTNPTTNKNTFLFNGSPAKVILLKEMPSGPSINVGTQTNTITYGAAVTDFDEFTVTASNFTEPAYNGSIEWVTTAHDGITLTLNNGKVLVTTTDAAKAGTYKFKVVSGEVESPEVTLTIGKATYSGTAAKTVYIMINKPAAQTGSLTAADFFATAPTNAKIKAVSVNSNTNSILSGTPSLDEGTLSYTSAINLSTEDLTDTYDVTIESDNYNDITATLGFTTMDKTPVTISGLSAVALTYTGSAQSGYTGVAVCKTEAEDDVTAACGTLVYTYTGTGNTTYEASTTAPTNAGTYKLVVSVSEDNANYSGSVEIPFTIAKKSVTVKADNKSMTVNGTVPGFTVSYTGFVGSDTAATALDTNAIATCDTDGKTVGSYDITITNAALNDTIGSNYTITSQTGGTLTVSAPVTAGGGGDSVPASKVPVIVDGVEYNIGTASTSGGVTTVTVDQTALQKQLDAAKDTVVVPVTPGKNADAVVAQFVVANVDEMAAKKMTLSVQVDNVSYNMRAVAIDTEAVMKELGATDPTKAPVSVTITELSNTDVKLASGELVLPPVSFTVTASYGSKTVEVDVFEKYVQRVIEIPTGVDASKITTAVVIENGKQRHVPTDVFEDGGKWYAKINSLTNSTYALIFNEASFTDAQGKWFEAVVTEMASRGIINGYADGTFGGQRNITRAEFAAILVRALGIPETGDASAFTDIENGAWYTGAVGKAYEYKLIEGRGNGIFDPQANITRQEAMAMVHRAAAITELAGTTGTLAAFSDADSISAWALADTQWNVGSGLIQGNSGMINGQDNITRGETATIILRLLQKSELVDVRTKA